MSVPFTATRPTHEFRYQSGPSCIGSINAAQDLAQALSSRKPLWPGKDRLPRLASLWLAAVLSSLLCAGGAHAANLIWDAGNTNGTPITPASGAWDTDTTTNFNWYNGTTNVSWTQTGTTAGTMGAIFQGPGAADGTYQVPIDGGQVAATNLVANASGYTFSGSGIYLTAGPLPMLMVSNGVSVVFSNNLLGNNANAELRLGDNGPAATMTVYGTITGWQPQFTSTNGSVFYLGNGLGTGASSSGTAHVNADVRMTNGIWNASGAFVVGRVRGTSSSQPNNSTGVLTLDGPNTTFNQNNDYLSIGRDSVWNSTVIVQNGATLNDQVNASGGNPGIGLPRPGSSGANNQSWMKVYGGTVNMGTPSRNMPIYMQDGGSLPGQLSVLTQTGGVINAWGGIVFGGSSATRTGGSALLTNSGGFLYIGANGGDGLRAGLNLPPTNMIVFSGGTVGAVQSWHSPASLPITLDIPNGNITFQCAGADQTPFNISLDQTLKGPGGFNKSGGGQLILSGVNSYAGSTVVSNGVLQLTTSLTASSNGPVILDGSAGSPDLVIKVSNQGQYWSVGSVTFAAGTPTIDFQFGQSTTPSRTVAAIQGNGDLNFTATPTVLVTNAGALGLGTYPLIAYSGTASGTAPTTATLPSYCSGYLSNSPTAKVFSLVITQSTFNPAYVWSVNSSNWDFSSKVWRQAGNPNVLGWADGNGATFDDTAPNGPPGGTNIIVTLNTTVSPSDLSFNNLTNAYSIVGNGNLATSPGGNLELLNGGTVGLATTNTYPGGTIVSSGSLLNLNSGGNAGATPIGTNTLTLNPNARLGNTSGSAVIMQYPVPEQWNGAFSFVGNSDLNMGTGQVTLAENTIVNVATNNLIIGGSINDGGNAKQLIKAGNGTLTLGADNSWNGLQLQAGQLNLNSAGAAGAGFVTIVGGSVDNTSGTDVTLTASAYHMSGFTAGGTFTFWGTGNLDFGSAIVDANIGGAGGLIINAVSNTLATGGIQSGNTLLAKTGSGIWKLAGSDAVNNAVVTVNQGEFDMARDGGNPAIGTGAAGSYGGSHGLVVNSSALAKLTGLGNQISHGVGANSYVEVVLNTGVLDLNGNSQAVDMIASTGGVLRNSADNTTATLTITGTGGSHPTNAITLYGANCQFDTPPTNAVLTVAAIVNGSGTLVKTGNGTVTLQQSNSYTGNITVNAGALSLSYADMPPNATVTVSSGAVLNLNFANSETNTVSALVLGGANKAPGIYNSTTDPTFITGEGDIQVVPFINQNPGTIQVSASGSTLSLAWPTNGGWKLQTNAAGVAVTNAWFEYPGSTNLTNLSITINPSATNVFFRLLKP